MFLSIEKVGIIIISLFYMLFDHFPLPFLICFVSLSMFNIWNIMCQENFLFLSNILYGILHASCTFMGISAFVLEEFSLMILFKTFPESLSWSSSLFSIPMILMFVFVHSVPDFLVFFC